MSDAEDATPVIEDLATLRAQLGKAKEHDLETAAIGGFVVAMLFALPLGVWLGTDAGFFGGVFAGLGWWFVLVVGLFLVTSMTGDGNTHRAAALTTLFGGLLAATGWFLYYGEGGLLLPTVLSIAGPAGGLLAWRSEARGRAKAQADPPLGLGAETVAALRALPESLAEPLGPMLDRAVADVNAIDRLADNGMLEASGHPVIALQSDVDRAMRTLARRALVADTMLRRGQGHVENASAEPVLDGMRRIADELHNLTDAALIAAASTEADATSLAEHIGNLRLSTEGQAEIRAAVDDA